MKSKVVLIKLKLNQILNTAESPRVCCSSRFFEFKRSFGNFDCIKIMKSCKTCGQGEAVISSFGPQLRLLAEKLQKHVCMQISSSSTENLMCEWYFKYVTYFAIYPTNLKLCVSVKPVKTPKCPTLWFSRDVTLFFPALVEMLWTVLTQIVRYVFLSSVTGARAVGASSSFFIHPSFPHAYQFIFVTCGVSLSWVALICPLTFDCSWLCWV